MINEKEKQEKILNFNTKVGNQNNNVANEFLSLTNWDVAAAVNLYHYSMPDINNININNQNNLSNFKYVTEFSFENSGFLKKVGSFFKSPFMKNNAEYCNKFAGKIKCLVKTGATFTNLLKSNKGVIILYSKDNINRLNQQLQTINNDNQNNYLNSLIIYPIINDSIEGSNLIKVLKINRFPCYLFCKYKENNVFYILDKMEGIFYLDMFKNSIFPQNVNSYIENPNINKNDNSVNNNINNLKKENNLGNKNIIQKSNIIDNKNKIELNNNQIPSKNEIKKEKSNNNKNYINNEFNEFSILNNQNLPSKNDENNKLQEKQNLNKKIENDKIEKNIVNQNNINKNIQINNNNNNSNNINNNNLNNNNNNINNNKINNNNINNKNNNDNNNNINNNNNKSNPKPKKEYIPDYRDYQFDNEPIIPIFKPFDLNEQILPSYSNFNFNNNPPPISDSAIRNIQDSEMKELEKMEEERERKEREEKEKKRKEEEEKKKMEQKEKEDKELFSKLIPPEPDDDNPDKCIIIFRLPDGEKNIQRKFLKTDKVAVLYDYIRSLGKEIYSEEDSNNFSIIQTFPYKNLENKLNNTLEEEGLFPNSMLQIKENN